MKYTRHIIIYITRRRLKIYHYTDLNGLKGILERKCFWATHYSFLNDSQEIEHGIRCINNTLDHINGELSAELVKTLRETVRFFKESSSKHAYNISFCLEPDLLSMWRGYGNTQKVSLEFDNFDLFSAADSTNKIIYDKKVIYTEENSTTDAMAEIIEFFKREHVLTALEKGGVDELLQAITFAQLLPPFFKNKHFSEEQEYRYVIYAENKLNDVKIRTSDKKVTPYLELKMHEKSTFAGCLPLKGVKIGPGQNSDELKKGIQFMLDVYGFKDVKITTSEVSYRS
ncbi:DUF2971 domain-containing protein [Pantoea dispersa]|uniref:DUF2971 domain-containing protein n=1 Tax=Pantoea dispersa TaxID=59814 RepID=UPI001F525C17|nr:DUF2971 domain-containing protein [Pantoea dispersa]MCI1029622.1 DUF2971 domain-containing protein [Pantoea dispersa]